MPFVTSSSLLAAHRLFFVRCSPFATSCPSLLAFRHFFVPPPPPRLHSSSVLLPSFRPTPSPPFSLPVGAQPCCLIHFVATIFQEDWQSEQGYSALFFLLAVVLCSPSRLCPPRCSRFFAILVLVMCQLFALRVARRPSLAGPPRCSSPSPRPPRCSPSLPSPLCPSPSMYLLLRLSLCLYVPLCPLCASLLSVPLCPLLPLYVPLCLVPLWLYALRLSRRSLCSFLLSARLRRRRRGQEM